MSSSANRRPRVAGQRRRPLREDGPAVGDDQTREADLEAAEGSAAEADSEDADVSEVDADASDTTEVDKDGAADGFDEAGTDEADRPERSLRLPAIALALSLALLAAILFVTREDPGERPRAASAAVATARSTLERILSYNHSTMTQQLPATQALLTGGFKKEFGETMTKTIVPMAQKDKTVVKARVYEAGVMSQTDTSVTVQAFVNQAKTSDTQKEPSIDQNRVIATMTKSGDRWLVSALKAY